MEAARATGFGGGRVVRRPPFYAVSAVLGLRTSNLRMGRGKSRDDLAKRRDAVGFLAECRRVWSAAC